MRFKYAGNQNDYYVYVTNNQSRGCEAAVGYTERSGQSLNLLKECLGQGSIQHEFLHSLGFVHQQSTHNRDQFVKIVTDNINEEDLKNFVVNTEDEVTNLGQPYDYESIMHYWDTAFSKSNAKTIIALNPVYQKILGQRKKLSPIDITKIKILYKCDKKKKISK